MLFIPVVAYAGFVTLIALLAGHSRSVLAQDKMHKQGHMNHRHMRQAMQAKTSGKHSDAAKLD